VAKAISTAQLSAPGAVTVERQDFSKLAIHDATGVFSSEPEILYIVRFVGRNGSSPSLTVTFTGTPSSDLKQSVTLYTDGSAAAGAVTTGNRPPGAVVDLTVAQVSSSTLGGVSWAAVAGAAEYTVQWHTTSNLAGSEVCSRTIFTLTYAKC
jgi:hypothetical protein